ncbi:ATP-grasp domain-containing protein [Pseudomonas sichuanensis]|uniref:ATP-binding protein n=1 Tax=Pseudomonas sichuanensis TaxID=2213015 RepID=UPI00244A6A98|nr:biotin carboxylase N-terminal domain-containing protein [Pseudomonas sichuanensis]MDH0729236.1 ATP-grasp domain-containing protein [Pseudomonas sichuanensis]MDH1585856.1 ATP-grasp domain-containing protein [Pseudomonas sichuanensis]MDH1595650.1 ATP-grasp domain-containing protein [Pseudomonas sichuanensis]MDH1600922.1 ATP-grasp domain-containing protein [Pseudomonas sichuanensis]
MKKVLIANRGEIAVRIVRACRDYGVASVAVYADSDIDALHVHQADEAYALSGQRPTDTYLNIEKLLEVAAKSGADAVHPGYGFLSERADFARAVIGAGLTWIGPDPETIDALGDKVQARRIALKVGAPLVAGTEDPVNDASEVLAFAEQHGLPIAIKAAFGGGGRGLKVAWQLDEVSDLYESAVREAITAFGRGECFVERFLDRPRHIEAQIIADRHGRVVVVGTRDCSLQRRNQKLIEEAPAPYLNDALRQRIHESARDICAEAGYVGAGTVEFLLSADGTLSFLEVNTRLQVEHPVTEETSGIDLVMEQLRVAQGLPLSFEGTPVPRGHSFEFRINAEDAGNGFLPTPGVIERFQPPSGPGVRLDTGVVEGSRVSPNFDSMIAKLIVTGSTREQAIRRARRALAEFRVDGVATVLPFHRAVMGHEDFTGDDTFEVHTRWIETDFAEQITIAPRNAASADPGVLRTFVEIDGKRHELGLPAALLSGLSLSATVTETAGGASAQVADPQAVTTSIAGNLHTWLVEDGANVEAGQVIAVMEAMKMETSLMAPCSGKLEILETPGSYYEAGSKIGRINSPD